MFCSDANERFQKDSSQETVISLVGMLVRGYSTIHSRDCCLLLTGAIIVRKPGCFTHLHPLYNLDDSPPSPPNSHLDQLRCSTLSQHDHCESPTSQHRLLKSLRRSPCSYPGANIQMRKDLRARRDSPLESILNNAGVLSNRGFFPGATV